MHARNDIAWIAQHGDDVKVAIEPQARADDMEIPGVLRQIDPDIAPVLVKGRLVLFEGVDFEAGAHALGNESRTGAGAHTDDVNPFHSCAPREIRSKAK